MPLTGLPADVFGVLTITSVLLFLAFSLFCIYRCVYFSLRTREGGRQPLGYFNGPWIIRITLILAALLCGFGEIVRLSILKGGSRLFTTLPLQKIICKFYLVSNLGFAEPCVVLTICFLLHASLQKREFGALSRRWNRNTIVCILLFCLPIFVMQLGVIFIGPKLANEGKRNDRTKLSRYFFSTSYLIKDKEICTYPLVSSTCLGIFDALAMTYVLCLGARLLSSAINKGLRTRAYALVLACIVLLPSRVLLLGFSVLLHPDKFDHEFVVFLAFCTLICCSFVGVLILVYYPVADSLALPDVENTEMIGIPYDDFYNEGIHLIETNQNQSNNGTGRSSDASTIRGSISFRALIGDDNPVLNGRNEASSSAYTPWNHPNFMAQ